MFSRTVTDYWFPRNATSVAGEIGSYHIVVDDTLRPDHPLMLLDPVGTSGILSATSVTLERLGLIAETTIERRALGRCLATAQLTLHGADQLFYLPVEAHSPVQAERVAPVTRRLQDTDASAGDGSIVARIRTRFRARPAKIKLPALPS